MPPDILQQWSFLPLGFALSVLLETPVLLMGLSSAHAYTRRLFAGVWLTACTYPIVILVLPLLITPTWGHRTYVAVAEVFAPTVECLLFWLAFGRELPQRAATRDALAIIGANLTSWLVGSWLVEQFGLW